MFANKIFNDIWMYYPIGQDILIKTSNFKNYSSIQTILRDYEINPAYSNYYYIWNLSDVLIWNNLIE